MTRRHPIALMAAIAMALTVLLPSAPANAAPTPADTAETAPADTAAAPQVAAFSNRVATFNVCNPCRWNLSGGPPRRHLDLIEEQIRTYRPQVLALQEICVNEARIIRAELELEGLHYNAVELRTTNRLGRCLPYGQGYGIALFSAAPLSNQTKQLYTVGGTELRGYIAADTTVAGRTVRVFATHLAQAGQSDVRRQEVQQLLPTVRAYPQAIVLGDFNAEPTAAELAPMWTWFGDADPNCGPTQNLPPCKATADASAHRKKFDYIWLLQTGNFTAANNGVHGNFSDHDLVHADLSIV
jgi:endonuclease/exonuclease/phosphatase family metal-dependent hydrolase